MGKMIEALLRGAKWATYSLLCAGNYHRYMGLRAAAVRYIASRGLYERDNVRFLQSHLRPGDTAVDVGANLGAYAMAMAAAVGPSGKVLAFEPLAEPFEWLRHNTRASPQVSCFEMALSDRPADGLEMNVPLLFGKIPEPSLAQLDSSVKGSKTYSVRVTTLDSYQDRLDRLAFIKIDVEGHELNCLQGARETIAKFRPLIQFESNDLASHYSRFQAFSAPLGYSVCDIDSAGKLRKLATGSAAKGYNFYLAPDLS